jgi:hypothetical protein
LPDVLSDDSFGAFDEVRDLCIEELVVTHSPVEASAICADSKLRVPRVSAGRFSEVMANAVVNTYSISNRSLFGTYGPEVFYSIWDFGPSADELPAA